MMRDLRLLLWLRWRHLRGRLRWWLYVVGMDLDKRSLTETLYGLYIALLLGAWFVLSMAWAASTALEMGETLGSQGLEAAVAAATLVPFVLFAAFAVQALRSSPVKLSFSDIAYVAGSTLDTRAVALVGWVREAGLVAIVAGTLGYLAGAGTLGAGALTGAPARTALTAALSAMVAHALAWVGGLARMARRSRPRPRATWLLPIPIAALALALPASWRWPGTALAAGLLGESVAIHAGALAVLLAAEIVLMALVARRLDMTAAIDESALFAQLQAFRPMMFYDADAYREIARRKRLSRRRPRFRLARWTGPWALLARAIISHARRPSTLWMPLVWGAGLLPLAAAITLSPRGILAYLGVLFAILVTPARRLIHVFGDDADRPSLRKLLPFGNVTLLMLDTAPAFLVMAVGAIGSGLTLAVSSGGSAASALASLALSLLLGAAVVLCRALERLTLPAMRHPIGSGVSLLITLVAVFVAGASSPVAACATAAVAVGVLAALVEAGQV
ncbi:MAG: hypothetical protein AB2L09_12955 [Coriobacteriia bacterium]